MLQVLGGAPPIPRTIKAEAQVFYSILIISSQLAPDLQSFLLVLTLARVIFPNMRIDNLVAVPVRVIFTAILNRSYGDASPR